MCGQKECLLTKYVRLKDALAAAGLLSDNSGDEGSEQIGDHTQPMDLSDDNLQSGGPHDDAQRDHFRIPDE